MGPAYYHTTCTRAFYDIKRVIPEVLYMKYYVHGAFVEDSLHNQFIQLSVYCTLASQLSGGSS